MCCRRDKTATEQLQNGTKTIVGYKVLETTKTSRTDNNPVVRSTFFTEQEWKQGVNESHRKAKRYNKYKPHGIHFYFHKPDQRYPPFYHIVPVRIDPKDIIAAEHAHVSRNIWGTAHKKGTSSREGVALKVTISQQAWTKLMKSAKSGG